MTERHFPIRAVDRRVFEALRDGTKKVETRAGSPRYQHVAAGDTAIFDCGEDRITKKIVAVRQFPDVHALVDHYGVQAITPWLETEQEQTQMYHSFPGHRERIARYGLIAMELA
jgi:ASC-1-like (ASCH) protein